MVTIGCPYRVKFMWLVFGCVFLVLMSGCTQETEPLKTFNQISTFQLDSTTGEKYDSDNGKIKLLTFIFINCPDGVCQMTMADFSELQGALKEKGWFAKEVELVAITFDPERDDLRTLQEYSAHFEPDHTGWHFLRGTTEQTEALADDLNYVYGLNEDGTGFHATTMYLVDGNHHIRAFHKMSRGGEPMDQELILDHISRLINE